MAAQNSQNVCQFYKFGYCKHKDCCRKQHIKKVCENNSCEISKCSSRHPKICNFYRDNGQCKFDPCMFKHVKSNSEIESIQMKLNAMEEKLDKVLEISNFEKYASLEKQIREKDLQIETLQKTIEVLEKNVTQCTEIIDIKKKQKQEETFQCKECNFIGKNEKGLNIHMKRTHGPSFNCDICDKYFKSERLLKIHNHTH